MGNINVGNLVAGLSMDSTGFSKGLESATKATDGFKGAISKISTALKTLLTNPVVLIGALIASLVALGKACWDAFEEMEEAYDKIQIATGATGDALDDLKESFDAVFTTATYVSSADELAGVIGDLNTYLGVTGETLEKLSAQFSNLAGMDSTASVGDFSKVINKWGVDVEQASGYLDYFFTLSQQTGISMDSLSQGLTSGQATLQAFGFSLEESAQLIAQMNKAGFDSGTLSTSLRMLMSSGVTTKEAFNELVSSIENATTSEEAFGLASKFGSRNVAEMTSLIKSGAFSDLGGQLESSAKSIELFARDTEDFGDIWERKGREASNVMARVGSFMNDVLVALAHFGEEVQTRIQPVFTAFGNLFTKIGAIFSKFWNDGEDTAGNAVDSILGFIENLANNVASAVDWFAENVVPVIEPVIGVLVNLVKVFANLFSGNFESAFTYVVEIAKVFVSLLYTILETGFNFIVGGIESFLQWIVDAIFAVINGILDGVETMVNGVISIINGLIKGINKVSSALGLPSISLISKVNLEVETPKIELPKFSNTGIAQSMQEFMNSDSSDMAKTIVQNFTINGDVSDAHKLAVEERKVAESLGVSATL